VHRNSLARRRDDDDCHDEAKFIRNYVSAPVARLYLIKQTISLYEARGIFRHSGGKARLFEPVAVLASADLTRDRTRAMHSSMHVTRRSESPLVRQGSLSLSFIDAFPLAKRIEIRAIAPRLRIQPVIAGIRILARLHPRASGLHLPF